MKLPAQLSCDIDYLIPDQVVEACELDRFDVEIVLHGVACRGQFPRGRIWVDRTLVWQGTVMEHCSVTVQQKLNLQNSNVELIIEMYDKDDILGTHLNDLGHVSENQSLSIEALIINDIDIIKNKTVFGFGHYHPNLSEQKLKYFLQHGHTAGPNHSLTMTENGQWQLNFELPAVRSIARMVAPQSSALPWPDNALLSKIINQCNRINKLKQQLKSIKESDC